MDFEIWASDSGNMLFATPDRNEALTWAFNYWLQEGDEALRALSIGDERDQWVVSGEPLRDLVLGRMWHVQKLWVTSASDRVVDVPHPHLTPVS